MSEVPRLVCMEAGCLLRDTATTELAMSTKETAREPVVTCRRGGPGMPEMCSVIQRVRSARHVLDLLVILVAALWLYRLVG